MNLEQLEKIMQLMQRYDMDTVSLREADSTIKISRRGMGVRAAQLSEYAASVSAPGGSMTSSLVPHQAASAEPGPHGEGSGHRPRAASTPAAREIKSPFVGTYYSASSPGSDPFIHVGKRVKKGEVLCIIEAMKLMNEIEAEGDGIIVDILIANEEPVEYEQPLFLFE